MIAVDTQILVYAYRADSPWHAPARSRIEELANSGASWAMPLHCLVEFHAVVTRAGLYKPASTTKHAIAQIDIWQEAPSLSILSENAQTWSIARDLILAAAITGPRVYDARIAAVCLQHGVTELWTHDRDMSRFPSLRTRNPMIDLPTRASEPRANYGSKRRSRG
ncbi:MAG: PIN domain-containing protein [Deltaproteobacteria bacterium]|nr:PIN domain-containing protein [Deltaproteobacteria bacterium]